ncbi:MAG: hypothetical protein ACPGU1_15720 [Myxococcota bacterium]
MIALRTLCVLSLLLVACGSEPAEPGADASDAVADVTASDDVTSTVMPEDSAGPPSDSAEVDDVAAGGIDADDEANTPISFGLPDLMGARTDSVVPMPGLIAVQPAVAVSAEGETLVVFTATPGAEGDLGIYASLAGQAAIPVKTEPPGQRNEPSVCRLSGGGFAAAWAYDGQAYGYTLGVEVAVFDSDGVVVKAFEVTTEVEGNHWLGAVGCSPEGGFTVVGSRTDTDDTTFGVFAQHFDAAGEALGAAFGVNPTPEGTQVQPVVGIGPGGTGVVIYEDAPADGSYALTARGIDASGAVGDTFSVLSLEGTDCLKPAVAVSAGGAFAYAGNIGTQVTLFQVPFAQSLEPMEALFESTGIAGMPAVTFLDGEDVVALAMLTNFIGAGEPSVTVQLLGEGVEPQASMVSLGDDPTLPPYPPAIAYGAGTLAVAWTQRTDGGYELHLSEFEAPVLAR